MVEALVRIAGRVAEVDSVLTREAASTALLDWFAAALAGSDSVAATAVAEGLDSVEGPARVVGIRKTADAPVAALINGTAAHSREIDDIFSPGIYHPAAATIAAALAVADKFDVPGAHFEDSLIVGYEVGCAVAEALGPAHYRNWHTTGTAGTVGAAAAAAALLGLEEEAFGHALALSATMASGIQQTFRSGTLGKPLHAGHAAQSGVIASLTASRGLTGAPLAFEGPCGLAAATGAQADWSVILSGEPRGHIRNITFKPYPCCGHTFAAIDGALELRGAGPVAEVDDILVETYRAAIEVAGIAFPASAQERRFSIPYLVAYAWIHGRVTEEAFGDGVDPAVNALAERVRLVEDGPIDAAFPGLRGARVMVAREGKRLQTFINDRSGGPVHPMSAETLSAKFISYATPALGARGVATLERQIQSLRSLQSVREMCVQPEMDDS